MYQGLPPLSIFAVIMTAFAISTVLSLALALLAESRPRWRNPLAATVANRLRPRAYLVPQTVAGHPQRKIRP